MRDETDGLKPGLIQHPDRAYNAETPLRLLDPPITPAAALFVRCNGDVPILAEPREKWRIAIDGEVDRPVELSLAEIEQTLPPAGITTVIECAGNGRSFFGPGVDGIPWGLGAVGCLRFDGVRLRDLLDMAGVKPSAVYVGHESPDVTPAGAPALSRGLPLSKALADETIVAFRMNGEPLPALHGGPARIVAPGFPGSAWQKWLRRIWVRDREHDGARMTGLDYRLPRRPVAPGETVDPTMFDVITRMPPRALVTTHVDGDKVSGEGPVSIGGWAWGHDRRISRVSVSIDEGATFTDADLGAEPATPFAWRRFTSTLRTPSGHGPIAAIIRAETEDGETQPIGNPGWNPKGYCNNACQRLRLRRS